MGKIVLEMSFEQLTELSKFFYLGHFVAMEVGYEDEELERSITLLLSAHGHLHDPREEFFAHGGPSEPVFTISMSASEECHLLLDHYIDEMTDENIACQLTERDFAEKYGAMDPRDIIANNKLWDNYTEIFKMYETEIARNGLRNFRLLKMEQ